MADLRQVLNDPAHISVPTAVILAALAAADEPLMAEVECHACVPGDLRDVCRTCNRTGTVRIVAMTEDVLRERLRDPSLDYLKLHDREIDAIVRAILGGDDG